MIHATKYTLTFLMLNLSFVIGYSQVAINENGNAPDASAMLDISSTDKGLLIPRMTSSDRENIASPATGLLVFDSTTNSFWYYSDSWQEVGGAFISKNNIITSVNNNDSFVVGADSLNHGRGDETKMFFDNLSGAFRAGQIRGKNWDVDSLGSLSFGWGFNTKASGSHATAFGATTTATDYTSTAFGIGSIASGYNATAFGWHSTASGISTTAFGREAEASGYNATAVGSYVTAPSYAEVVIGAYNTSYTPNDNFYYHPNDRLFVVGNGTGPTNHSDALRIYKNGNTELNGALTIDGAYTLPVVDGTVGQVLTTDGSGNVSWGSTTDNDDQVVDKFQLSETTLNLSLENDGQNDYSVNLSSLKDNLGNHTTTQNLQLSNNWISNDGDDEGIAIDNNGNVSTSGNLGIGGALSAQNSLTLFDGNQNVIFAADEANRRVILDVGGSGASSDAFIIGDLTNGTNEVMMLGNVGIGTFSTSQKLTVGARGDGTKALANEWDTWSDRRLKRDFKEITKPIEKLNAINGYYYFWAVDKLDQTQQIGVIAQEIETVLPEIVTTNPDGYKSVDYSKLTALLVEVNQAQQEQLELLQKEIAALKAQATKIDQLEKSLKQVQAQIGKPSNKTVTITTDEK